jgi:hypothetical protein
MRNQSINQSEEEEEGGGGGEEGRRGVRKINTMTKRYNSYSAHRNDVTRVTSTHTAVCPGIPAASGQSLA